MPHTPVAENHRRRSKSMGRAMTDAELKLWNELRAHRLMGLSFRRQLPIAGYIMDFACPDHRLIVEVDGSQHGDALQAEADGARTRRLEEDGWAILRFWNSDVLGDIDGVCQHLVMAAGLAEAERCNPLHPCKSHIQIASSTSPATITGETSS